MRLQTDPPVHLAAFSDELEFVIEARQDRTPEIYLGERKPRPDRHVLLGLAQATTIAIEEQDPDLVAFIGEAKVTLDNDGQSKPIDADLVIVRSESGKIGILALGDPSSVRRVAREVLRYFTRLIRLDIP